MNFERAYNKALCAHLRVNFKKAICVYHGSGVLVLCWLCVSVVMCLNLDSVS